MSIYSEEFEAWFAARFWHECYEDVKHHLFAAWQASRAALVIELPPSLADDMTLIEAIQLTGAKVK